MNAAVEEIKFEKNIGILEKIIFKRENNIKSTESGIKVKKKYFIILLNSLSLKFFLSITLFLIFFKKNVVNVSNNILVKSFTF